MIHCRFLDRLNEATNVEIKIVVKPEEKLALRLVTTSSSKLIFGVHQLAILECLLVNLSQKPMLLKFEKLNSDNSPVNIHKIIAEEDGGQGVYEIKEESSMPLKIVFFPRATGTFPFNFFRVSSIANKTTTPLEFLTQDIIIN